MPKTCSVTGCRSGYRDTDKKASLFYFLADAGQREVWKRAMPRQEAGDFTIHLKDVCVRGKHFDALDIISSG